MYVYMYGHVFHKIDTKFDRMTRVCPTPSHGLWPHSDTMLCVRAAR